MHQIKSELAYGGDNEVLCLGQLDACMLVGSSKLKAHEGVSTQAKRMATFLHLDQAHGYFSPLGLGHVDTSLYSPSAVQQEVSTLG